jgi:pimeloyl-ACP methyl ester carboxylesterase
MSESNYRKHGGEPYSIVVVHGGPGTPGGMAYVAGKLSEKWGVLEPFQTSQTIRGQIEELHSVISKYCTQPAVVIGHSWGAWLSFMLAVRFPNDVSKLILVSAGPFEDGADVTKTRLSRLTDAERNEALSLISLMNSSPDGKLDSQVFRRFGELMSKADSFDPVDIEDEAFDFQPEIYQSIWSEAEKLRGDGTLLRFGKEIRCSVVAIHGDYDPHPAKGVREPLQKTLKNFKFIPLKDCGHYPWKEKKASKEFFQVLYRELQTK